MKSPNSITKDILNRISLPFEDYCKLQFEAGLEYLESILPKDQWGQEVLSQSKEFWNWWKLQWLNRDRRFLHQMELILGPNPSKKEMQEDYKLYHSPERLKVYPSKAILEKTYSTMIAKVIDTIHLANSKNHD